MDDPTTVAPAMTTDAAPAPAEPVAATKDAGIEDFIDKWFFDEFHGSIVARNTEIWNKVHAAKESLKTKLSEFVAAI